MEIPDYQIRFERHRRFGSWKWSYHVYKDLASVHTSNPFAHRSEAEASAWKLIRGERKLAEGKEEEMLTASELAERMGESWVV